MGMNLVSGCHKCKQRTFHFRGKENETILPFYREHYVCMRENPANVETKEDQIQQEDWMDEYIESRLQRNMRMKYLCSECKEELPKGRWPNVCPECEKKRSESFWKKVIKNEEFFDKVLSPKHFLRNKDGI